MLQRNIWFNLGPLKKIKPYVFAEVSKTRYKTSRAAFKIQQIFLVLRCKESVEQFGALAQSQSLKNPLSIAGVYHLSRAELQQLPLPTIQVTTQLVLLWSAIRQIMWRTFPAVFKCIRSVHG